MFFNNEVILICFLHYETIEPSSPRAQIGDLNFLQVNDFFNRFTLMCMSWIDLKIVA